MPRRLLVIPALFACLLLAGCAPHKAAALFPSDSDGSSSTVDDGTDDGSDAVPVTHDLVYTVSSPQGGTGIISYDTLDGGTGGVEQTTAPLPWTKDVTLDDSPVQVFSLVGQSKGGQLTISCTITLDGTVISQKTSTGRFSVVTCSGSNQ